MGFWNRVFGSDDGKSHQMPSTMVAEGLGEVNVLKKGSTLDINFTILMEPTGAEGWQTGVAIDASGSMEGAFGRGLGEGRVPGGPPQALLAEYQRQGLMRVVEHEGEYVPILSFAGKQDLVAKGYFGWTVNEVEPMVRKVTAYLASNLDADGGTTVIYWACGDGGQIEVIGDLTAEECVAATFAGPREVGFGGGTSLTPAVDYFAERFKDAKNGMYVFITDGRIEDMEQVKAYTIQLCRDIHRERRHPLKCVLIGVGDNIDEEQMEQLDDLESGTSVDVWDHKIAADMRSLVEIFAEVVNEHQIVAPTARILDATGKLVKHFADGLPAKVAFSMPASSQFFELEVSGQRIRQTVVPPR